MDKIQEIQENKSLINHFKDAFVNEPTLFYNLIDNADMKADTCADVIDIIESLEKRLSFYKDGIYCIVGMDKVFSILKNYDNIRCHIMSNLEFIKPTIINIKEITKTEYNKLTEL